MELKTFIQSGTSAANALFDKLADTSDGAVKTRERLFSELKSALEAHVDLEARFLFPVLRRHDETKDLVSVAQRENRDMRALLEELDALPKNDELFPKRLKELRTAFRQHARDEKKELLPAVQHALDEGALQKLTDKIESAQQELGQMAKETAAKIPALEPVVRAQSQLVDQSAEAVAQGDRLAKEGLRRAEAGADTAVRSLHATTTLALEWTRLITGRPASATGRSPAETSAALWAELCLLPWTSTLRSMRAGGAIFEASMGWSLAEVNMQLADLVATSVRSATTATRRNVSQALDASQGSRSP
jgi:hypothetical protein